MADPIIEILMRVPRETGPFGTGIVHMSYIEPDPNTFRHEYWYNTRENQLYMRMMRGDGFYFWKRVTRTSGPKLSHA
jgi:hypothetical protein